MSQNEAIVSNGTDGGTDLDRSQTNGVPASLVESILISGYLLLLAATLLAALVQLWPAPTPAGGAAPATTYVVLLFWGMDVSDEVRLLLLVAFTGALGGLLHALRSVAWYIGQRELMRNWLATYITQPFVGATLAFIFYLVIRGGFFSPQASFQQTSPFGFAAMAGLIGMFSPQAVLKLKEVAETILTKPPAGKDSAPQEPQAATKVTQPRPSSPIPAATTALVNPGGLITPADGMRDVDGVLT